MKETSHIDMEVQARSFIENELIPEVMDHQTVTRTLEDFIRYGVETLISKIVELVKEYGICLKQVFGRGMPSYQFWYETE